MILGTPKIWWIAAGLFFVGGLALFASGAGGPFGIAGGVLLILVGMVTFAVAPMRYGRKASKPPTKPSTSTTPPPEPAAPPRARPRIEAGNADEV
jgi:hypothetical protein